MPSAERAQRHIAHHGGAALRTPGGAEEQVTISSSTACHTKDPNSYVLSQVHMHHFYHHKLDHRDAIVMHAFELPD